MKSYQESRKINTILVYAVLGAGAVLMIFPFLWMLLTSFKSAGESVQIPPTILPKEWLAENYNRALIALPFVKLYTNTVLLILFRVICAVAFSSAAGFAFAKLKFRGKNLLFSLVIMQMMLPSQIFIIPQYQMLAEDGTDQHDICTGIPGAGQRLRNILPAPGYMGIPDELGEAAYLDGCTKWQTFTRVMMPLTKASMAALTIFTAVFAYADLMWPLIANTDINMMTLSAGLSTLRGQFTTNYPVLMAGSMLAMIPMVILYLVFQKQFIEGIAMTGGK